MPRSWPAAPAVPASPKRLVPVAERATAESQKQKMDALNQQLRSVRDDNARLRAQLEQSLGQQRLANATGAASGNNPYVGDM